MSRTIQILAPENNKERLDKLLTEVEEMTRSFAQRLMEEGAVLVDGEVAVKSLVPKGGSLIEVTIPDPKAVSVTPQNIPLSIVYEDKDLLVVNKPKGMVVHPAAGHYSGTLVNALMFHCGKEPQ